MARRRSGSLSRGIALLGLLLGLLPLAAQSGPSLDRVDPLLLERLGTAGRTDLIVRFAEQADLSPAYALDWDARGPFVVETLQAVAGHSQRRAIAYLDDRRLPHETYIAGNELYVHGGDLQAVSDLASWPEVAGIRAPRTYWVDAPVFPAAPSAGGLDWGLVDVQADRFWSTFRRQGQGMVVANIDTGVQWDHPALDQAFRCGTDPTDPTCWYDPTDTCGSGGACDTSGHGTHTMGTLVGDDDPTLPYQVGMAPAAQWIACKACPDYSCSESAVLACADWILAPGGSPDKRPQVVNNSWGRGACDPWFLARVDAWRAAGIFPAFSAGNYGGCTSLSSPGAYQEAFASAAHDAGRNTTSFSSKGPSCFGHGPYTKPNLSAPGEEICSAVPTDSWSCSYSGTSMASPHSAGAVALLWSCRPELTGQVDQTFRVLQESANPSPDGACGAPPDGEGNYTYGYGYLDVLAAGLRVCDGRGWLAGHVSDAVSGTPVPGALVVAQGEMAYSGLADAAGFYTVTLMPGTYTLTATAYGYWPGTAGGVSVVTDTVTAQDLALQPLPTAVVSGTVTELGTGASLAAQVQAVGVPVLPVQSDPATGFYSITLAQGPHTLRVTSPGYAPAERGILVEGDQTQAFQLEPRPCLLVVDDDQDDPDLDSYYRGALDLLGPCTYRFWDAAVQGDPGADDLQGYRVVAWYTGYPYSQAFTAANEAAVAAYLDAGGGSFFLSSEDYLWEMHLTAFGRDYLGIADYVDDVEESDPIGNAGNPVGDGLGPLTLTPPVSWTDVLWTDAVTGTQSPFRFQSSGANNSTNHEGTTFRAVFFAWPLEGIASDVDRAEVLAAVIRYLGGCGSEATLSGRVTHAYYGTPLAGAVVAATAWPTGTGLQTITDPAGRYLLGLEAGIYSISAEEAGYATTVVGGVAVVSGSNRLDLALASPVVRVAPASMRGCAEPSDTVTLTLHLANLGAAPLTFQIAETTTLPLGRGGLTLDIPWLSASIPQGVVPAGGVLDLAIALSADPPYHVVGERYMATLTIAHDDPMRPGRIAVPVAMAVAAPCDYTFFLPVMGKPPGP